MLFGESFLAIARIWAMPQMEIVESILAGKYSTLSDVGQTMVPYVQVPEEPVDFDDNWLNGVSLA